MCLGYFFITPDVVYLYGNFQLTKESLYFLCVLRWDDYYSFSYPLFKRRGFIRFKSILNEGIS